MALFKNFLKPSRGATATAPRDASDRPSAEDLAQAQALIVAGNGAEDAGRMEEAHGMYQRAVALAPHLAAAHLNLGIAQEALGDAEGARMSYQTVLALAPAHPFGAYNLGKLDYVQGRLRTAETLLRQAVAGKEDFPQAWVLLSSVLEALGDLQGAARAAEQALRIKPDYPGALSNYAGLLRRLGRVDDAAAAADKALRLEPDNPDHLAAHSEMLAMQGFSAEALDPLRRAIALQPHRIELRSRELFLLNLVEGVPVEEIWERHRQFGAQIEAGTPPRAHGPQQSRPRLRVGFVSGELRTHPVALFLLPVLERRNRSRFEVVCYSSTERKDVITQRLQALSDCWVDAAGWKDEQLTEAIVADGIDVLVDLDGHTSNARLAVFAARPAPAQLAWVGYLNTTGLTRMDWRLTDARCDPPAASQRMHTERLLLLPHSQWCYRPFLEVPCAAAAPCERNGFVTFGSLNSVIKLTTEMALRWGRILQALPTARLLVADVDSHEKRAALLAAIAQAGGVPDRVRFAPRADLAGYYRLMDEIDIALDSHPYGGGTTTFDALWMGVPVLTASGPASCSRSASSVLALLGLGEWIAPDISGFEALAIERAGDLAAIAHLRRTLRGRLRASPLMDEASFVAAFEAALEQAWRERGGAAAHPSPELAA